MDESTGDVSCTLYYTRKVSYSELNNVTSAEYQSGTYQQTKILQVNAKTGALLQGWTYRPWNMLSSGACRHLYGSERPLGQDLSGGFGR